MKAKVNITSCREELGIEGNFILRAMVTFAQPRWPSLFLVQISIIRAPNSIPGKPLQGTLEISKKHEN